MKRKIALALATVGTSSGAHGESALKIASRVGDIRIAAAMKLPSNPKRIPVDQDCSGFAVARPRTAGGRLAAEKGWIVTSETKLGAYDAVTFVGALSRFTGSTCVHERGNLGFFDGPRLRAIAYQPARRRPDPNDVAAIDSFGVAEQMGQRRIRLHWGLPSPPLADVVLHDGILIEPTAPRDAVCSGAAVVPNVFGQDIRKARKKLRSFGWLPVKPDQKEPGDDRLNRQGVTEVEACSGVEFGFCAFDYRHKKGFGMRIISGGDEYPVLSYDVFCGRSERGHSNS